MMKVKKSMKPLAAAKKAMAASSKKPKMRMGGSLDTYTDYANDYDKVDDSYTQYKMGGKLKKAQNGVMETKLKDVPGKVKNAMGKAYKKVSDRVKNTTVGDVANAAADAFVPARGVKKLYDAGSKIMKSYKSQIAPINKSMPKKKSGGSLKKAKSGGEFGMLSVKAGVDNNPNPTFADKIAGAKKKAMSGTKMMKMGGKAAKQAAIAIAMKKDGVTPKKKMQYGGVAASMVPPMKKSGKVKKAQDGGSYITTRSGRVGRTYGKNSPYGSMDTTGYSKGKKEFDLNTSIGGKKGSSKIKREDVPAKIKEFKKGATRKVTMKSGGKMKKCKYGCN